MNIDSETSKKIQELQVIEHNMQAFLMQKQSIQLELNEIATALDELKNSSGEVYKILGGIMIKANRDSLTGELKEKKKLLDLRLSSVEKQEKLIEAKSEELRNDINKSISAKD